MAALEQYRAHSDGSAYLFLSLIRLRRIGAKVAAGKWKADAKLCNNLLRGFRKVHDLAKLPEPVGTIHDLRKSYGTYMASRMPMHVLQVYMGHANITTTAKYYCRVQEQDADAARKAMRDEQPKPLKLAS